MNTIYFRAGGKRYVNIVYRI